MNQFSIIHQLYLDINGIADGIEFFVHEGTTPTWEELKTLCE